MEAIIESCTSAHRLHHMGQFLVSPTTMFGMVPGGKCDKSRCETASRVPPVVNLTLNISDYYKLCNPSFKKVNKLPQRMLTKPCEPALNDGHDNKDGNLICRVHDKIEHGEVVYNILDMLGTGTFGQVFRCCRTDTKQIVAIKIIKNKPAYHAQGQLEIKIATMLNTAFDPSDEKHIVRILSTFEYRNHICVVFELLNMSLLDVLTQNQFRGLPLQVVQRFTKQILIAITTLQEANVIHCDLKPENILLVTPKPHQNGIDINAELNIADGEIEKSPLNSKNGVCSDIKVIDFGSACFEGKTMYSYIQSRFCKSWFIYLMYVEFNSCLQCRSITRGASWNSVQRIHRYVVSGVRLRRNVFGPPLISRHFPA
jgi:dual specificity protein kinase YAK1